MRTVPRLRSKPWYTHAAQCTRRRAAAQRRGLDFAGGHEVKSLAEALLELDAVRNPTGTWIEIEERLWKNTEALTHELSQWNKDHAPAPPRSVLLRRGTERFKVAIGVLEKLIAENRVREEAEKPLKTRKEEVSLTPFAEFATKPGDELFKLPGEFLPRLLLVRIKDLARKKDRTAVVQAADHLSKLEPRDGDQFFVRRAALPCRQG